MILFTVFHYFCDIFLFMQMLYDNVCKCLFILYVNIFVQSTELYGILGI